MFPNMKLKKLFFWTLELLALAVLILIVSGFDFLMRPINVFVSTVFVPLLVAGFLYYVLKPILKLIKKITVFGRHMPHQLAVIITFVLFLAIIAAALVGLVPTLIREITNLITAMPSFVQDVQRFTSETVNSRWFENLNLSVNADQIRAEVSKYAASFLTITAGTLGTVVATITSVTINLVTIPVVLFYMLSDGERLVPAIKKIFPNRHAQKISELTTKMDNTIEKYISGQAIEMLFVGITMAIGYMIIGQPYAWLLAVVAGITNIVPYIGPWIGVVPALIVASTQSWKQMLFVFIVMTIVQQLDGNFIYPNVIGKSLAIHPLTIMLLLMVAGNLWGIVGMIVIVPVYAVLRVIISFVLELVALTKNKELRQE
ncbi:AI-2E family transporter [Leuconostoc sp. MS02]|uniref:AI-2E family transporter n=1 Tax=Leuconostoc aquikimchii TaxID=3236804 RepID=A0ABV3S0V0_9LACO